MSRRDRLAALRRLSLLERIARDMTALDHADALNRADAASSAEREARASAALLADRWLAGRIGGALTLELDRVVAASLIAGEQKLATAGHDARRAADAAARTADEWRRCDARHRAAEHVVRDAERDARRARDEAVVTLATERALLAAGRPA